mgnify:FL=1
MSKCYKKHSKLLNEILDTQPMGNVFIAEALGRLTNDIVSGKLSYEGTFFNHEAMVRTAKEVARLYNESFK